ncbi:hypothetical protein LXL04_014429 [Taraxacum kok-saghyz]
MENYNHGINTPPNPNTNIYPPPPIYPYPMYQHQQSNYNPYPEPQNVGNYQMSLHDIVTSLAMSTQQFQETTRATISNMQAQLGDMATIIDKLESCCTVPFQTVINPIENVNMVSSMSVQEIEESMDANTRIAHILATYTPPPPFPQCFLSPKQMKELEEEAKLKVVTLKEKIVDVDPPKKLTITPLVMPPPFPSQLEDSKKKEEEKEFLDIFRKIEINLALLDALKQLPCHTPN